MDDTKRVGTGWVRAVCQDRCMKSASSVTMDNKLKTVPCHPCAYRFTKKGYSAVLLKEWRLVHQSDMSNLPVLTEQKAVRPVYKSGPLRVSWVLKTAGWHVVQDE